MPAACHQALCPLTLRVARSGGLSGARELGGDRKLAEVRPRSRDVWLALYLPRPDRDPRFARVFGPDGPRVVHILLLRQPEDVDDQVRRWLTEAFIHASD